MFLHLVQPDRKFLDQIRSVFEGAAPGRHQYVVVGAVAEGQVLPVGAEHVRNPAGFLEVFSSRPDWEGVIVHGLPFEIAGPIVETIPTALSIACFLWGFEVYGSWPRLSRHLLMPETRRVVNRLAGPAWKRWVSRRLRSTRGCERAMRRVTRRYDYYVGTFPEEYDLFVSTGLLQTTRFHWGSYGSLEDYVDVSEGIATGDDIQLGNSASATNNHLDAFPLLRSSNEDSRKVIVPLSYGDSAYRDVVLAAGQECVGSRFSPISDFVTPAEYRRLLRSCGHVVMNHRRQQAWGNIIAALWRGSRVYLNDTVVYRGLRRFGFDALLIEEVFGPAHGAALQRCTDEQARCHRDLLRENLDREKVLSATEDLLEKLAEGSPH